MSCTCMSPTCPYCAQKVATLRAKWAAEDRASFERRTIRGSSVALDGGGDTHFHLYGKKADNFCVTTRLRGGADFHDKI